MAPAHFCRVLFGGELCIMEDKVGISTEMFIGLILQASRVVVPQFVVCEKTKDFPSSVNLYPSPPPGWFKEMVEMARDPMLKWSFMSLLY